MRAILVDQTSTMLAGERTDSGQGIRLMHDARAVRYRPINGLLERLDDSSEPGVGCRVGSRRGFPTVGG